MHNILRNLQNNKFTNLQKCSNFLNINSKCIIFFMKLSGNIFGYICVAKKLLQIILYCLLLIVLTVLKFRGIIDYLRV